MSLTDIDKTAIAYSERKQKRDVTKYRRVVLKYDAKLYAFKIAIPTAAQPYSIDVYDLINDIRFFRQNNEHGKRVYFKL